MIYASFNTVVEWPRSKKPIGEGWQDQRLELADLPREFFGDRNIGLLLGGPSGGLADVDLDCNEALALAPAFLPTTAAIFGRRSKPHSHWLYQVTPTDFRTTQFRARPSEKVTRPTC